MTIGFVQIYVLKLAGRWEKEISIASRIGLEEFVHNRKQVVAHQSFNNLTRIRRRSHRVGVVDKKRVDRRVGLAYQYRPQAVHIQFSRHLWTDWLKVVRDGCPVPFQPIAGTIHQSTTRHAILPC